MLLGNQEFKSQRILAIHGREFESVIGLGLWVEKMTFIMGIR